MNAGTLKDATLDMLRFVTPWNFEPITSNCLDRHRPEIIENMKGLFRIAFMFYLVDYFWAGSFFEPKVWGYFATQFPAQIWATISLAGCSFIIIGLLKPPNGWLVSLGAFIMFINFMTLGYSAAFTAEKLSGFNFPIVVYSFFLLSPMFVRIFIMGVRSYGAK